MEGNHYLQDGYMWVGMTKNSGDVSAFAVWVELKVWVHSIKAALLQFWRHGD